MCEENSFKEMYSKTNIAGGRSLNSICVLEKHKSAEDVFFNESAEDVFLNESAEDVYLNERRGCVPHDAFLNESSEDVFLNKSAENGHLNNSFLGRLVQQSDVLAARR